jgi:hypothetical protein
MVEDEEKKYVLECAVLSPFFYELLFHLTASVHELVICVGFMASLSYEGASMIAV